MVKKAIAIIFLLVTGFLSLPVSAYAQECTSRITKNDVYNGNPEVQIQILNNGIENSNTLRIASSQFTTEHLTCPLGFTANSIDPHSVTCSISTRHLDLNELNKISLAYSGSGASYGNYESDWKTATATGWLSNYNNWTNPNNLYVADNNYSTYNLSYPNPIYTGQIIGQFGSFNIPTNSTITGIVIETKGYVNNYNGYGTVTVNPTFDDYQHYQINSPGNDLLWYSLPGYAGSVHTFTTNGNYSHFGDLGYTPAMFNSGNLSLVVYVNSNQNVNFAFDYFKVKVQYKSVDLGCFSSYINSTQCISNMGTLCPQPGGDSGVVIPNNCNDLDIFCKFQQWAGTTFMYWFGFNEDFSQEQFSALNAWLNYKFPMGYLVPIRNTGFGTPIGSPSATLTDFNIGFTPKQVVNGVEHDLTPVSLVVTKDKFNPVQPFLGFIRGFFVIILWISFAVYIIYIAGKFF